MSSHINFPYSSFFAPHSNTLHVNYIQQEQTSHQAQQLHCLKSTEHEGLNKKSVSIFVPADGEDKGQDQRWYFKQKVDSNYPCILLSGKRNLTYVQDSKASTSAICKTPLQADKELQHRGRMLWLLCWMCRDCPWVFIYLHLQASEVTDQKEVVWEGLIKRQKFPGVLFVSVINEQ